MKTATRIPRRNETTKQRLTRLVRERNNDPHHEDYEDGNPDRELRTRGVVKNVGKVSKSELEAFAEYMMVDITKTRGQTWSWKVIEQGGNLVLEMKKVD